jgi:hypothetical protein
MIEDQIARSMFNESSDKTLLDKILGRKDSEEIRRIMRKDELTRTDLNDLLNLMASTNAKLLNFGEWDRYILLKFYVWVREIVKINELFFDFKDDMKDKKDITLTENADKMFNNIARQMEHNVKFMIDLYFNIANTTLALGGTAFIETLRNKYEIHYPQTPGVATQTETKKGIFGK